MGPRAHGLFLGQAGFLRKPGRAQARGPLPLSRHVSSSAEGEEAYWILPVATLQVNLKLRSSKDLPPVAKTKSRGEEGSKRPTKTTMNSNKSLLDPPSPIDRR
jgi:hypothetical protein